MSEAQIQAIKDVIKMTPRLSVDCLNSIRILMEKAIESELLRLEPTVILDNMDITEKVMYLDYLMESKETKELIILITKAENRGQIYKSI